ncbi:hypothetical protein AJ80_05328 [Polytolypa hystricis UAMH7299]|uniref:White collar 1 protein n=1 Tax=Polytolypa hystricis (strain UAMH7299) TaxID=1447883 RepID=A0A2B7Y522_POLH7|nr:hypothetical protein AJ80_05328 [Polytolypa hystricis UAMH7299]
MNNCGTYYDGRSSLEHFDAQTPESRDAYLSAAYPNHNVLAQDGDVLAEQVLNNDLMGTGNRPHPEEPFIGSTTFYPYTDNGELLTTSKAEVDHIVFGGSQPINRPPPTPVTYCQPDEAHFPQAIPNLSNPWEDRQTIELNTGFYDFQRTFNPPPVSTPSSISESNWTNVGYHPSYTHAFSPAVPHALAISQPTYQHESYSLPTPLNTFYNTPNPQAQTLRQVQNGGNAPRLLDPGGAQRKAQLIPTAITTANPLAADDIGGTHIDPIPEHVQRALAKSRLHVDMSPSQQPSLASNATWPLTNHGKDDIKPSDIPVPFPQYTSYEDFEEPKLEVDVMGLLGSVTSRRNPEINIGPIDLSCAFVICRIDEKDTPIIFASDAFTALTGYSADEVFDQNCRFLQEPNGNIKAGEKRLYVDDTIVQRLRHKVRMRSEVQVTLMNYRKGGQPFLNLLTLIPVRWASSEPNFFVGFQIDLVENPQAITKRNSDGSYTVNYQQIRLPLPLGHGGNPYASTRDPRLLKYPGDRSPPDRTTLERRSEPSKSMWEKALSGSLDFLFHVVSANGVFLNMSQASTKVLGYEPTDLVGQHLSSVCHPSDIAMTMRDLRDVQQNATVNLLYRIRTKARGYIWFECEGSLYTEMPQNRRSIVLLGRKVPVYSLSRQIMGSANEGEIWAKISTSGIFLFVSSSARILLDRKPDDLVGETIQSFLKPDSRPEFERSLEASRTGRPTACTAELQHRRGHMLAVRNSLYPGDMVNGPKPTFLVLQIRFLKPGRPTFNVQRTPAAGMEKESSVVNQSAGILTHTYGEFLGQQMGLNVAIDPEISGQESYDTHIGLQPRDPEQNRPEPAFREEDSIFDELRTTRGTNWQMELEHLKKRNRVLSEELQSLLSLKKKRKRKKGGNLSEKSCARCYTKTTPEWRRGPSGNRDLCNSCGLRWAKQNGRISPRKLPEHDAKRLKTSASQQ